MKSHQPSGRRWFRGCICSLSNIVSTLLPSREGFTPPFIPPPWTQKGGGESRWSLFLALPWPFCSHLLSQCFSTSTRFSAPSILDPKIDPKSTKNLSQIHSSCHSSFNFDFQSIFGNFSSQAYTYRTFKILRIICVLQCFCQISIFLTMILSSSRPIPKMLHVGFQNLQKSTFRPIEIAID